MYNQFTSNSIKNESKSYGYRWSDENNVTFFIINIECKTIQSKTTISRIVFISYVDELENTSFPEGQINIPPAKSPNGVPNPPPPPGR